MNDVVSGFSFSDSKMEQVDLLVSNVGLLVLGEASKYFVGTAVSWVWCESPTAALGELEHSPAAKGLIGPDGMNWLAESVEADVALAERSFLCWASLWSIDVPVDRWHCRPGDAPDDMMPSPAFCFCIIED